MNKKSPFIGRRTSQICLAVTENSRFDESNYSFITFCMPGQQTCGSPQILLL